MKTLIVKLIFALGVAVTPLIGLSVSDRLQSAISRAEACHKWNNPGCLMYAGQANATRGPGGYAVFKTPSSGRKSLRWQIRRHRGMTVAGFLRRYNPSVSNYAERVIALSSGLEPADIID